MKIKGSVLQQTYRVHSIRKELNSTPLTGEPQSMSDAPLIGPSEEYKVFLTRKIKIAKSRGVMPETLDLHPTDFPHQQDVIKWALEQGRALIAAQFGLGKTTIAIELARLLHQETGAPFLVVCPLGVKHQFVEEDGPRLGIRWQYVRTDAEIEAADTPYLITNYERCRDGQIDPRKHDLCGVALDEGAVLRSLGSKTYQVFLDIFSHVPYRFVCTATPSPNRFRELIYYAKWLGVMDSSEALAQPLDAKLLTPTGWKPMGEVQVGDQVIAGDGTVTKVSGVFPQGERDIVRIHFSDGASTECTLDHLWLTKTQYERNNERRYQQRNADEGEYGNIKTTAAISESLRSIQDGANHAIPMVHPVAFQEAPVFVDPYVMGVLLGDGYIRDIGVSFSSADEWIIQRVAARIDRSLCLKRTSPTGLRGDGRACYDYRIVNNQASGQKGSGSNLGPGSNPLLCALREYGLVGKHSWDKYIPRDYLLNSAEVRLAILQGLMDTDGSIAANGTQTRFSTTSKQLANDLQFLVWSLGGTAMIFISDRVGQSAEHAGRTITTQRRQYRLTIRMPDDIDPFSLPRKSERRWASTHRQPHRLITRIEKVGRKPAQCIMVEHPSHLYVTDDFIVTHNTRWFKRNPDKAGDLTIMPQYEREFWLWVASWAIFLQRPSDLGYDDTGYALPPMRIHWHRLGVDHSRGWTQADQDGQLNLLLNASASVSAEATERRETLPDRIAKMTEIIGTNKRKHWLIWHHLEDERRAIEKALPEAVTVFGSQELEEREDSIIGFSRGKVKILATKPSLAGSGCNFQRHCHSNIFLGVDYKFADFIQAIHRTHRFQQPKPVDVHIIYAESQDRIVETLKQKWAQHEELMLKMSGIMKEYGLSHAALKKELGRKMGVTRVEVTGEHFTAVHNDCVPEMKRLADNSVDLVHTSVPFGNHYEYSIQIEDFGHNPSDGDFFVQMDYLIPDLLRVLKPGRVAAVHVKDRVLYGHQTSSGFMEIGEFSDDAVKAFKKHGFMYEGRRTIVTDVVRENNSSYRLGWSEMCKDASKMGSGLPEYLLLFRKPPTGTSQQYADEPVIKNKKDYTRGRWQVDAHAIWRSSGDRPLYPDELATFEPGAVSAMYTAEQMNTFFYDHARHVAICEAMDKDGHLPSAFMLLPPKVTRSDEQEVWDDVNFLNNLNAGQMRRGEANHLCPLSIDVVERTIRLYSNPGDLVLDPFAGLFTVPYVAIKLGRRAYGIELADNYFKNGVEYCQAIEQQVSMPTLFDMLQKCEAVAVEE